MMAVFAELVWVVRIAEKVEGRRVVAEVAGGTFPGSEGPAAERESLVGMGRRRCRSRSSLRDLVEEK